MSLIQCPTTTTTRFRHPPLSPPTVKFTVIKCCSLTSPVTVVNGNLEMTSSDKNRNEIRLGLPSKGRMAADTLDLLKDCQLSVRQLNPRQYVADIPQASLARFRAKGDYVGNDTVDIRVCGVFNKKFLLAYSMKIAMDCFTRQMNALKINNLSNVEVWFQRPKDIVRKLVSGDLDLGIVGLDTLSEYGQGNEDLILVHDALAYGDCRLSLARSPKFLKENGLDQRDFFNLLDGR
ncbi:ATP phosphoribosyltransferase 2, chloroplastic [Artemisia annua]|uniref:ATP phosphoribosyltransferase n=1 Tax=Artemisia annua TaxID=35608 RepID=A0A2U1QFX8_ARTAN|nr:ATP phosphoribosyltransferase 2, chloroplastic [Artemisia annua]